MNELTPPGDITIKASVIMASIDIDTFCKELQQSQFCPPQYRQNHLDIKFAILYGSELGFSAFQSIKFIKMINGKPSLDGDGFLACCKSNKQWEDMHETFDDATQTAYCEAKRKGHEPLLRSFSWDEAVKAGLTTRNPVYKTYPKRMLQHRARGFALRDLYADSLCGFISSDEARDYEKKEIDVTPETPHQALFSLMAKQDKMELVKSWLAQYEVKKFSELPLQFITEQLEVQNNV